MVKVKKHIFDDIRRGLLEALADLKVDGSYVHPRKKKALGQEVVTIDPETVRIVDRIVMESLARLLGEDVEIDDGRIPMEH